MFQSVSVEEVVRLGSSPDLRVTVLLGEGQDQTTHTFVWGGDPPQGVTEVEYRANIEKEALLLAAAAATATTN